MVIPLSELGASVGVLGEATSLKKKKKLFALLGGVKPQCLLGGGLGPLFDASRCPFYANDLTVPRAKPAMIEMAVNYMVLGLIHDLWVLF